MRNIRVNYPSGQFAFWATAEEARRLVRSRVAEGIGSKQKLHRLQLIDGPSRPVAGTKYSHNRATEENPQGVFALRKIADLPRELFRAVEMSVLAREAA